MAFNIKKSDALLSFIFLIAAIVTLLIISSLVAMLIGNYTAVGKYYYKFDKQINELIEKNILGESAKESVERKKQVYLFGHPWFIIILIAMTSVTALSYVIKGIIYFINQFHENKLEKSLLECLEQ